MQQDVACFYPTFYPTFRQACVPLVSDRTAGWQIAEQGYESFRMTGTAYLMLSRRSSGHAPSGVSTRGLLGRWRLPKAAPSIPSNGVRSASRRRTHAAGRPKPLIGAARLFLTIP